MVEGGNAPGAAFEPLFFCTLTTKIICGKIIGVKEVLRWFKKLFCRYNDYEECGTWGSFNTETGEVITVGKMYSRTIKVAKDDGSIALDTEWITDEDMEHEKATGEQVGPASDPPESPEDPTLKADWWK